MTVFDFAGHRLDTAKAVLSRSGVEVALRRKSFQLLTYLLENRGRVIGKEELVEAIWPGIAVTDDSLTQCITDIRRTLGAEAEGLIRTVPRRGYRLDDEHVAVSGETGAPQAAPDRERASIAVLPFASAGGDARQEWLSDGIAEDIITALAKSPGLRVLSRNLSFSMRGREGDLIELGRRLGVRHLLCGSVRSAGDALRVTTELVDADNGGVVWAERFDRRMGQIFVVQDEIAAAVVARLRAELLPAAAGAMDAGRPDNLEAYLCFLRGRQLLQEWTVQHAILARRMFERAADLETGYARAYSGMALCDTVLYEWRPGAVTLSATIALADRALAIDPLLPEALAARATALFRTGDIAQANADYDRALALDADCYEATFFRALMERGLGRVEAALALYIRAAALRPDDYVSPNSILGLLPDGDPTEKNWAEICYDRAARVADLHPENSAPLCRAAVALVYLGRKDDARNWMARALAMDAEDPVVVYNAATVHAMLGEDDMAFGALEKYLRISDRALGVDIIRHDREFVNLKGHPRYIALIG